jgi:iron-sulfur cluster insertion protein
MPTVTQSSPEASALAPSIRFTDSAAEKVYELIEGEGNLALNLRVFISGGGCSGFQYGFAFEEKVGEDDTVIEKSVLRDNLPVANVKLLVDSHSFQYLTGAEIDYKNDIDGQRFVIRNPNAKTTCGCGSSFSPAEPASEAETSEE